MKVTYDIQADKLRILFSDAPIFDTRTDLPDLTIDRDQHGRVVGVELATASLHVADPHTIGCFDRGARLADNAERTTMAVILVGEGI